VLNFLNGTDNATYINPDIIAQEQFGGWNNKEAVLKAANHHAEEMHHNCIKNQQNFIFKEERIKIINTGLFFRILSCLRGFL
jgi:predicted ABC-type ATPase